MEWRKKTNRDEKKKKRGRKTEDICKDRSNVNRTKIIFPKT
jgi:hypothetical protein